MTKVKTFFKQTIELKSKDWERESEWRLIWFRESADERKAGFHKANMLDNTITAVYLGCQMPDRCKKSFILETTLHFPNAKIFKATKKDGAFALDFKDTRLSCAD